jgi:putative endonuclease
MSFRVRRSRTLESSRQHDRDPGATGRDLREGERPGHGTRAFGTPTTQGGLHHRITMERGYFVYVMSSFSRCLYVGVTNDLVRRVGEHRGLLPTRFGSDSFTRRYNTRRLVFLEATTDVQAAITREKQIKSWDRARKLKLIERFNPQWDDLAAKWPEIRLPD